MTKVLTLRVSEEDLDQITRYAKEKKLKISSAIRELIQLALKLEEMKKSGENSSQDDEENFKKLLIDAAAFTLEGVYLLRDIIPSLLKPDEKSAEVILQVAKRTSREFIKNRIKSAEDK